MVSPILVNHVSAFGRLLEYSSNKRFGFKNKPFQNDNVDKLALGINSKIRDTNGLDILSIEEEEMAVKYESAVNNLLSEFTYFHIINPAAEQRALLRSSSFKYSLELLVKKNLVFYPGVTEELKAFKINQWNILDFCNDADNTSGIKFERDVILDVIITKRVSIHGKDRLFFCYLKKNSENESWNVLDTKLMPYEDYNDVSHDPIETFLKLLDHHGIDMEVEGKNYRYIHKLIVPYGFDPKREVFKISSEHFKNSFTTHFQISDQFDHSVLFGAYTITTHKLYKI